jgi:hypothetical protein
MMGFKAFHSAQATIAGIKTAHMIRKGQLSEDNTPASKTLFFMRFSFMSGMAFRIATSKKLWKKEGLMWFCRKNQ